MAKDPDFDRQFSHMTTVSAPPGQGSSRLSVRAGAQLSRFGRYMKSSVADFFGVGEENKKVQQWENRRKRYAGSIGKLKAGGTRTDGLDEVDMGPQRIIDPLRVPGRYSETEARTPLSSTSTYYRNTLGHARRKTRKDSVAKMTWQGLATLAGARKKFRTKQSIKSRSYAPASLTGEGGEEDVSLATSQPGTEDAFSLVDDVFFDEPIPAPEVVKLDRIREESEVDKDKSDIKKPPLAPGPAPGWRRKPPEGLPSTPGPDYVDGVDFGLRRIAGQVMDKALERHKRHIGMGFIGRCMKRQYRRDHALSPELKLQLDELDDHRPFFTYWVTFVQIVVFIVALAVYGIAPIGISETVYSETVRMPNLAMQLEHHLERDNLWIGPRQADLIHLGGKYSPCMRRDTALEAALQLDRDEELTSGCCVRNDGSGCAQMVERRCSDILSTFIKYSESNPGYQQITSGAVCGQDPEFCTNPLSQPPFQWSKKITEWPLCLQTDRPNRSLASTEDRHMTCEVVGHPCCHGIQGECIITTREHCDLKRGYYHENAFLCSQVNCMMQICGMIPFSKASSPDQFYRLWTSIFLHGGLVHLIITVGFQMLVMRDQEKLTGAIRMAIIYLGSGIAGNLASCIFLPYQVEAGPSGAQFGLLACLLVEVLQSWQMYQRPVLAVLKLVIPIILLFLLGLLPWFDNWAHLFGFLFGFLLSFAILPYVSFGQFDRRRKIISIIVALGAAIGLFALLIILFYVAPITNCPGCKYFNCIPFTADFCKNMEVAIKRNSTYSLF